MWTMRYRNGSKGVYFPLRGVYTHGSYLHIGRNHRRIICSGLNKVMAIQWLSAFKNERYFTNEHYAVRSLIMVFMLFLWQSVILNTISLPEFMCVFREIPRKINH